MGVDWLMFRSFPTVVPCPRCAAELRTRHHVPGYCCTRYCLLYVPVPGLSYVPGLS